RGNYMAFGIKRDELIQWKRRVNNGEIAFLTHYWEDPRFPTAKTVTKEGCSNLQRLIAWGKQYGLQAAWIHHTKYTHFNMFEDRQKEILYKENIVEQINRFNL